MCMHNTSESRNFGTKSPILKIKTVLKSVIFFLIFRVFKPNFGLRNGPSCVVRLTGALSVGRKYIVGGGGHLAGHQAVGPPLV